MIILGIDPGLALTGWGIIKYINSTCTMVDYGTIVTPADTALSDRLIMMYDDIKFIIKKFKPAQAGIEKLFFNTNAKTAMAVGQARGVILLACRKMNLPITEFTPLQIKLSTVGYGQAEKKQVQIMMKKLLNLNAVPKPDDAADALAVAITCAYTNDNLKLK